MVFDLRGALMKKQEVETARLLDFEFRERVRTMRLLAERLDVPERTDAMVGEVARRPADDLAEWLAGQLADRVDLAALIEECRADARRALVKERGDPTPHRLS